MEIKTGLTFSTSYKNVFSYDGTKVVKTWVHRCIQRDSKAGMPVWVPKLGAQKSFLVQ